MDKQNISAQMNFASFAFGLPGVEDRKNYIRALHSELESVAEYADKYTVSELCITGTHPLQYQGERLGNCIRILRSFLPFQSKAEITVHALPGSVTYYDIRSLSDFGVTRVSFDTRTFLQSELDTLGRTYAPRSIEVFMRMVQKKMIFFNFDVTLHYGLPGQTPDSFRASVEQAIRVMSTHITLLPDESADKSKVEAFYQEALNAIASTRFEQYTPHHFAQPECASRWNKLTYASQPRLGFGVGAISMIEGTRCKNTTDVAAYIAAKGVPSETIASVEEITPNDIESNAIEDELYNLRSCDLTSFSPELQSGIMLLCEKGLLAMDGQQVRLTLAGMADWDTVSTTLTF